MHPFARHTLDHETKSDLEVFTLKRSKHTFFSAFTFLFAIIAVSTIGMILNIAIDGIISAGNKVETIYYIFVSLVVFLMFLYPVYLLFITLRPKHRETLTLSPDLLEIDTGTYPIRYTKSVSNFYRQLKNNRRRCYRIDKDVALKTRLIRDEDTNFLQIVHGNKYVDVAAGATDTTREYLFNYILDYYEKQDAAYACGSPRKKAGNEFDYPC